MAVWQALRRLTSANKGGTQLKPKPSFKHRNKTEELGHASRNGKIQDVQALLAGGADPNGVEKDGSTALIGASVWGQLEVVNALIAAGADPNLVEKDGSTALMAASRSRWGKIEVVKALIAAGADVNIKIKGGAVRNTALMSAACDGHLETVRTLLAAGANVNAKNQYGDSALMGASGEGQIEVVEALIAAEADVNIKRELDGYTALISAAYHGHLETVRTLLAAGADVNAKSDEGDTALLVAVVNRHTTVAELLRANGPDIIDPLSLKSPEARFVAILETLATVYKEELGQLVQLVKPHIAAFADMHTGSGNRLTTNDLLNLGETGRQRVYAKRRCAYWYARSRLIYAAAYLRDARTKRTEQSDPYRAFERVVKGGTKWVPPVSSENQSPSDRLLSAISSAYQNAARYAYACNYGPSEMAHDIQASTVLDWWLEIVVHGMSRRSSAAFDKIDADIVAGVSDAF
jgi:ankyrin repeat protein